MESKVQDGRGSGEGGEGGGLERVLEGYNCQKCIRKPYLKITGGLVGEEKKPHKRVVFRNNS